MTRYDCSKCALRSKCEKIGKRPCVKIGGINAKVITMQDLDGGL